MAGRLNAKVLLSLAGAVVFGASAVSAIGAALGFGMPFIPAFLGSDIALKIFLLLAGIVLLYDSFSFRSFRGNVKITSVVTGLILAFLGAFPLLNQFGLLDFLPFVVNLTLSPAVLAGVLLFYSIYLLWDTYLLFRYNY